MHALLVRSGSTTTSPRSSAIAVGRESGFPPGFVTRPQKPRRAAELMLAERESVLRVATIVVRISRSRQRVSLYHSSISWLLSGNSGRART